MPTKIHYTVFPIRRKEVGQDKNEKMDCQCENRFFKFHPFFSELHGICKTPIKTIHESKANIDQDDEP